MRLALLTFTLVALLVSPALGAEAKLLVAGESFPEARVRFDLDPAWEQDRGEMAGTPMIGRYHLDRPGSPENEHCTLGLGVHGLSVRRRQRPVLRRGVLTLLPRSWWGTSNRLRIAHHERRGTTTLYRTKLGRRATGIAVLPTPSWIHPVRPVTVVSVTVGSDLTVLDSGVGGRIDPTPEQRAACDAFAGELLGPTLRGVLRSARVERRG